MFLCMGDSVTGDWLTGNVLQNITLLTSDLPIFSSLALVAAFWCPPLYRMHINYQRILQNHIFTNTEQKYMMLLPFERGVFAVS